MRIELISTVLLAQAMDKVVNEGSQWNKWVKDMKQIKVVKRRGQNEHLKQGDEQKQIYILK